MAEELMMWNGFPVVMRQTLPSPQEVLRANELAAKAWRERAVCECCGAALEDD